MKYLSVCISTYEMGGKGPEFLRWNFDRLTKQTFKDFEVVVSDQSKNDEIKKVCDEYRGKLDIVYLAETQHRGNASENINNAIRHASGKLIKILFLDDFLYSDDSLKQIVDAFDIDKDHWLVTASEHTKDGVTFYRPMYPRYDDETILFKNSISCPSVLTVKNESPLMFDPKLSWRMDLDYYKRCYEAFGAPKILNTINAVNRVGAHQLTYADAVERKREAEFKHTLEKFNVPHKSRLLFEYRVDRYKRALKSQIKKLLRIKTS